MEYFIFGGVFVISVFLFFVFASWLVVFLLVMLAAVAIFIFAMPLLILLQMAPLVLIMVFLFILINSALYGGGVSSYVTNVMHSTSGEFKIVRAILFSSMFATILYFLLGMLSETNI